MQNIKALLALWFWRRFLNFFPVISFGCHGNQISARNQILWTTLEVLYTSNNPAKFGWNRTCGIWENFWSSLYNLYNRHACTHAHTHQLLDATASGKWPRTIWSPCFYVEEVFLQMGQYVEIAGSISKVYFCATWLSLPSSVLATAFKLVTRVPMTMFPVCMQSLNVICNGNIL